MKRIAQFFEDFLSMLKTGSWLQEKWSRCGNNRFALKIRNIFFPEKHLLPLSRGPSGGRCGRYRGQRRRGVR